MTINFEASRNGSSTGRAAGQEREQVVTPDGEAVRIWLPWVPLAVGGGIRVSQLVLEQYADAVEDAIDLYMECRALGVRSASFLEEVTVAMWRVLQAAHPHPLFQWSDWETEYRRFVQLASSYAGESKAA